MQIGPVDRAQELLKDTTLFGAELTPVCGDHTRWLCHQGRSSLPNEFDQNTKQDRSITEDSSHKLDRYGFRFDEPHFVQVKGKGNMKARFLIDRVAS
eukprot:sb/3479066/